jgi:hypothetical protein
MTAPTVSYNSAGAIVVTWTAPYDGSDPITSYTVQLANVNSLTDTTETSTQFVTNPTSICDGT